MGEGSWVGLDVHARSVVAVCSMLEAVSCARWACRLQAS
jgi:hypothetical protein